MLWLPLVSQTENNENYREVFKYGFLRLPSGGAEATYGAPCAGYGGIGCGG